MTESNLELEKLPMFNPENLILAATNVFAFLPMYVTDREGDYMTLALIYCTSIMSTVSHIFYHKYSKPYVVCDDLRNIYESLGKILNSLDVLGCVIIVARVSCLYYAYVGVRLTTPLLVCMTAYMFNILAEVFPRYYTLFHGTWHVLIYTSLGWLLSYIYMSKSVHAYVETFITP